MPKKIVFCADGTWNGPEERTGVVPIDGDDRHGELQGSKVTNVVKLFANLGGRVTPETMMLHDEQEKALVANGRLEQVAKYVHGVGDSDSVFKRIMGGMFGVGVIARIVRGYTFISRHYEPGDEIHIIGFSRGAYTARALAGMISSVGLLNHASYDRSDKEEAYRLGVAAWCRCKHMSLHGAGKLTDLATHLLNFVAGFFARALPANGLIADVPIKSVAVWDTVGSLGIPAYADDRRFDVFRFVDTKLSSKVEHGLHAMAVDELRVDFPVTRWDDRAGVRQVWFVGAHADVGGGYPAHESRLSDIALQWMMRQLAELGVRFATPLTYTPQPEIGHPIHEPWNKPPFNFLAQVPRQVLTSDRLHESVFEHWERTADYRPRALAALAQAGFNAVTRES